MMDINKYGLEIIVDLHDCDISKFQKGSLDEFFIKLCEMADMQRVGDPHYWLEESNVPHLKGYSGVQFIKTSSIIIHTLDILRSAYINFFSCKDFKPGEVVEFIREHFHAKEVRYIVLNRI
jgi:S-adenosylmethionine/arginine decarboxylase-like enzyme